MAYSNNFPTAVIKDGKVLPFIFRHPWIFKGALDKVKGEYQDGEVVEVIGPKGEFLAWGWINSRSKLVIRLISFQEDFIEEAWFRAKLQQALRFRLNFLEIEKQASAYRLVHSEGDGIPGLIVDRYGPYLVVQYSCLALERLSPILIEELSKIPNVETIYRKDDVAMARMEGLEPTKKTLWGKEMPSTFTIQENGIQFEIQFHESHKTGFYLDQRENRKFLTKYAQKCKRALDTFCYTGGFSLNLAKYTNIEEIIAVDSSSEALKQLKRNAELNGINKIKTLQGNVFHVLEQLFAENEKFDLIILDPPKFIPNKRSFDKGFSGYKKLNRRAFRLIQPEGLILTCCCSQMMGEDSFLRMLAEAAGEAGREVKLIEKRYQPSDHPVCIACPEGSYLKAFLLQVY